MRAVPYRLVSAAGVGALAASLLGAGSAPSATAVFAGGCFWGVESVFEHVRGVKSATSGYAVPAAGSTADTGFAEAVRVVYDPARVSYRQLLEIYFLVAHDPTQRNRQGPDVGPRYRSIVFFSDDEQRGAARAFLDSLAAAKTYSRPIVTEILPLARFRIAEDFHQDYAARHPTDAYIEYNDAPKIVDLRRRYPALYKE
jgi:peptide-methionine (S)-S-oxide reductase